MLHVRARINMWTTVGLSTVVLEQSLAFTMASYKPILSEAQTDVLKDERHDDPTSAIFKRRAFLYLSILSNVLSFGLILGEPDLYPPIELPVRI